MNVGAFFYVLMLTLNYTWLYLGQDENIRNLCFYGIFLPTFGVQLNPIFRTIWTIMCTSCSSVPAKQQEANRLTKVL